MPRTSTMRCLAFSTLIVLAALAARPALAARAYCPNAAHTQPAKVPPNLVSKVAATFHIDSAAARQAAFVRCAGQTLMACYVGANLVCGKADKRRALAGATAWCRAHPGAKVVPMAATGHATIYDWSCKGRRAVAGKPLVAVDRHGYIAGNWRKVQ